MTGDELFGGLDGTQRAEGQVCGDDEDEPERCADLCGKWDGIFGDEQDEDPGEDCLEEDESEAGDVLGEDDVAEADGGEEIELDAGAVGAKDVVVRGEQAEENVTERSGEQVGGMVSEDSSAEDDDKDERSERADEEVWIAAEIDPFLAQAGGEDGETRVRVAGRDVGDAMAMGG